VRTRENQPEISPRCAGHAVRGRFLATAAQLVKLRYFVGLAIPQAAKALGISTRSAERSWAYARAWLHKALKQDAGDGAPE
jgi:hypothetical protein